MLPAFFACGAAPGVHPAKTSSLRNDTPLPAAVVCRRNGLQLALNNFLNFISEWFAKRRFQNPQ
jgi:hypothetical protein